MRKLLVLVSLLGVSHGWCFHGLLPSRLSSHLPQQWNTISRARVNLADGREPAGVERVFTEVKKMSKSQLDRLAGKARGSTQSLSWFRRKKKRLERRVNKVLVEGEANHYREDLSKIIKERVSLPAGWEFQGKKKELDSLAQMKMILTKDFARVSNTTVCLEDGQEVYPLEHFQDVYGDIRLLRFLRKDRDQDPVSAAMAYRRFLQWRSKNNVDKIRARIESQPFQVPKEVAFVGELFRCDFNVGGLHEDESDSHSHFTITLHLGGWRTTKMSSLIREEQISLKDFLTYWIYIFESVHMRLNNQSVKQQKMVFLDAIGD